MDPNKGVNPAYPSASLYVGDLAPDVSEGHLFESFNRIGPVASIRVCRDAVTRRSLGYAYVNFHSPADAERALETLNNTPIKGKQCRIMWSQRDPSLRKSGVGNIFIKNIDKSIDHKALYDTFSVFGNILSCKVALDENGVSKGYGFVHYETQEMADRAIEKVDGMMLQGKTIHVATFVPRKERQTQDKQQFTNVYIKNLDDDIDNDKLKEIFERAGPINSAAVAYDANGKSKCFGFVNFDKHEDAVKAIEQMNGKALKEGGKEIFVGRAQKKAEREQELKVKNDQNKTDKFPGINLYIKNLDDDVDEERLRAEFSHFGQIQSARVMRDEKTNSKGFGFVSMATPEEATRAVTEMNGRMLGSKPLYVALAQKKELRRAQLEAQFRQRAQGIRTPAGMAPPTMYQGTPPVFFPPPQPQGFVYPPQMIPRNRWGAPAPQVGQYSMPNYVVQPLQRTSRHVGGGGGGGRQNVNNRRGFNPRSREQQQGVPVPSIAPGATLSGAPEAVIAPLVSEQALTMEVLAQYPPEQHQTLIGERLFPLIHKVQPKFAGKITGMLLERYSSDAPEEMLVILNNPEVLSEKINEAMEVLQQHHAGGDDDKEPKDV